MAATSQPYRHNNAITAFTIWGNTFAGSRGGRINSLGRATYGRLPLNSQGVPSKLPLALSVSLFVLACAPSWSAAGALGRPRRFDASVDFSHELVRSGPYRLVRH